MSDIQTLLGVGRGDIKLLVVTVRRKIRDGNGKAPSVFRVGDETGECDLAWWDALPAKEGDVLRIAAKPDADGKLKGAWVNRDQYQGNVTTKLCARGDAVTIGGGGAKPATAPAKAAPQQAAQQSARPEAMTASDVIALGKALLDTFGRERPEYAADVLRDAIHAGVSIDPAFLKRWGDVQSVAAEKPSVEPPAQQPPPQAPAAQPTAKAETDSDIQF